MSDEKLTDCLCCSIKFSKDRTSTWVGQLHLITKLQEQFAHLVSKMQNCHSPGFLSQQILKVQEDWMKISKEDQKLYHLAIGTLFQDPLPGKSCTQAIRSLDGASQATFRNSSMSLSLCLAWQTIDSRFSPFKKPVRGAWKMPVFSNSNYARDIETRISMTGFCVFLMGVPSSWKSHAQRSMTLSSSKAEFIALSKATKDIKFIVQVLLSIGIKVKLSAIVQVDKISGIFMAENV